MTRAVSMGPSPPQEGDARADPRAAPTAPTFRVVASGGFAGPNLHHDRPIASIVVEFGGLSRSTLAERSPQFFAHVAEAMPAATAICPRLPDDGLPAFTAALALAAQRVEDVAVAWSAARPATDEGLVELMTDFEEPAIATAALRWAVVAVAGALGAEASGESALVPEAGGRSAGERDFAAIVDRFLLVHTTRMQIVEAARRGIPYRRLLPTVPAIQFGHGARQRRIVAASTERTSQIGQSIASDKIHTRNFLLEAGLPVPRQRPVRSATEAVDAATAIGFPVVVKAARVDKGEAVAPGLADAAAVAAAFDRFAAHGRILVEKHIAGDDHRCLVVGGRLVAVGRRLAPHVVGDGTRSIEQLVAAVNQDPRRGVGDRAPQLVVLTIDDEVRVELARQGLTPTSVPAAGQRVRLRATANISTGGTGEDVTPQVHPDVRAVVEAAARIVGLDIAGVDVITTDISRPLAETGGAICEINQTPGVRPHVVDPAAPDVQGALLDHLFPDGGDGRIPIAAVTGTNGKTTTVRMTARILRAMGRGVGQATTAAVEIDDRVVARGDLAGPPGAAMLLLDPAVETAVLETARGGIRRLGLGFDRCHVGAVLNVGDDHVGTDGIATREDMADVKSLVVRVATELAVLNARDPLTVAMRARAPARQACFVSVDPAEPLVGPGLPAGDLAATLSGTGADARLVLRGAGWEVPVARVGALPAADGGRAMHNVENALFAAAVAWGLGATAAAISEGLAGFDLGWTSSLGRLSIIDGLPFRVVIDYGHNAPAIAAVRAWAAASEVTGRRITMLNAPGNRQNQHYADLAAAAAGGFDVYVCSGPDARRGRQEGEVARRLAAGLAAAGVDRGRIFPEPSEANAIAAILRRARRGDLVVLFCHDPDRAWRIVDDHRQTIGQAHGG